MSPDDEDLARYLAPYPVTSVKRWIEKDRKFWLWFLTPCDFEPKFLEAKELALNFYTSLFRTPHMVTDPETGLESVDKTILNAKLKAAERLVGSGADKSITLNVSQATQNLNQGNSEPLPQLPVKYRKNPALMEGRIRQLREARLQTEDQILEATGE